MALDLRLQQKMAQQLVMTPQLQQAIKLLQLSHMEIAEALRSELDENPILEEGGNPDEREENANHDNEQLDFTQDAERKDAKDEQGVKSEDVEIVADMIGSQDSANTPEPTNKEVENEIDWDNYLDTYSYSLPASAGSGTGEDLPSYEATLSKPTSLIEHLRWQVQMEDLSRVEREVAFALCEELNTDGYLAADAFENVREEFGVDDDLIEETLRFMQDNFEPIGVAARSLRECLLIQVQRISTINPTACEIIDKHLETVEKRNLSAIAKDLEITLDEVKEAVRYIAQLEPRPGRIFADRDPQYITPDIYVHKVGDDYQIVLNEEGLPKLRISNLYKDAANGSPGQTKSYLQDKMRSAVWLIRSIHMRQRTVYKVMESILKFQREFFDKGVEHLKPLILKDVAEDVEMHESTISRVTSNKYVHTPRGIFELKYFFNSSISRVGSESIASEAVRNHIKRLIEGENPKAPLSDQQIVEQLKQHSIKVARRTVAKYREMMKIPPSSKRKELF